MPVERGFSFCMKMQDAIKDFELDCKYRKLSARTIDIYQKHLKYIQCFMETEFQITDVEAVRQIHLKTFLAMKTEEGRKPSYINDLLKVAKVFFGYCEQEGYAPRNISLEVKNAKEPKLKLLTFNDSEIRKLIEHFNGRDYLSIRNKTILALLFDTGIRLNELVTMRKEQICNDSILIHGKGNKERFVPVSPFLSKMLIRYENARDAYFVERLPEGYLFLSKNGKILTAEAISVFMKNAAKEVGVRSGIRVSPHTCRHTFAHLQLRNGLDLYTLSRAMGHENVAITQRYLEGIQDDEMLRKVQRTGVLANLR